MSLWAGPCWATGWGCLDGTTPIPHLPAPFTTQTFLPTLQPHPTPPQDPTPVDFCQTDDGTATYLCLETDRWAFKHHPQPLLPPDRQPRWQQCLFSLTYYLCLQTLPVALTCHRVGGQAGRQAYPHTATSVAGLQAPPRSHPGLPAVGLPPTSFPTLTLYSYCVLWFLPRWCGWGWDVTPLGLDRRQDRTGTSALPPPATCQDHLRLRSDSSNLPPAPTYLVYFHLFIPVCSFGFSAGLLCACIVLLHWLVGIPFL